MRFMSFGIFVAFLSLHSMASAGEYCAGKPVTEVVTFKLAAEASIVEFKASALSVEKELQKIPGYQRRNLLQSDTGEWVDIVNWSQLSSAKAAAVAMQENPIAQQFFSHIDLNSVTFNYYCE